MEALHSSLTTGEQSGGQEHCEQDSPQTPSAPKQQQQSDSSKPSHGSAQQPKQSKRQLPERKRLRAQRQSVDSDTNPEHKEKETKTVSVSELSPATAPGSKPENQEGTPKQKRERKPQKPGKYVCTYCGRACAKPSVLQKHIRSHTGERPYPCPPCGFSFKTKSNLYKHRKSHTHRVKAGLAQGEPRPTEEQITESEDEARHLSTASSIPSLKNLETNQVKDGTAGHDNSYAVRKRLAMRLSRGKDTPKDSADDKNLSLILSSKESTESGYFSRSESTEQSQDINPNASAKTYAEIILGKYGRFGHLQRMSRHNNQQSSGQEDKSVPFTLPKKQVIDHITKLITINEAVVDTSKIDSVKPRRFSLSRKNSDSQKSSAVKEAFLQLPKPGELLYKSSGSITMGVPCEKFQHHSSNVQAPGQTSSAPLLRSHSMPTAAASRDVPPVGSDKFRLTQSFDEREPSQSQVPRRYGMLRRQPAIDGEPEGSHAFFSDCLTVVPDHKQTQPQPYECESCGTGCKDWEGYKKHRQTMCSVHRPRNEVVVSQMECSQIITHSARPGMLALRKRRKAESFELEDPTSPTSPTSLSSCPSAEQCNLASKIGYEAPRRPIQTCSVIQHTSSFEKQESLSDCQSSEPTKDAPMPSDQDILQIQPELSTKITSRKLVRQHNVQVPEILVTEESNISSDNLTELSATPTKQAEKSEEFQWPQRSSSLAQLPIEKLPPKKKRLRLAEAAQSSGESSFESVSLPLSPSQESSASYASSRSTSIEESNRFETETLTSTSMRRSRAPQMLTVPGVHQHREMRRSASEQAPHDPQPQTVSIAENRSKSFDYSSLSPERSAIGWRERRKCLLIRHTAVRDPDDEELPSSSAHSSEKVSSSPQTSSAYSSKSPSSPLQGETISQYSKSIEIVHQWKQNVQFSPSSEPELATDPFKEEALKIFTNPLSSPPPIPSSVHRLSGAARAHYLPVSTGLKLEILSGYSQSSGVSHSQQHFSTPQIISSVERVQPITSTAVVVRFQTDTLTPACAIYTTLSQSTSPRPLEAVDAVSHTIDLSAVECLNFGSASPELPAWSGELRASGSGGNKRMLSPSNSIELSPESQQQQKRVKEDEVHDGQEAAPETPSCQTNDGPPVSEAGTSYPSMLSSTCNSWCYLNYIKPNPATLDEQKPSVYSSWSTSGYDPNPPGLSSKMVLSLLHCKQRLSPTIYTTSSMSATTDEAKEDPRPRSPEIYITTVSADPNREQLPATSDTTNKSAEERKTGEETWMAKIRSNEKCRDQPEDCPVNHKDSSVQPGSTQAPTPATPYNTHSSGLTKHTTLKAAEETSCEPDDKHPALESHPADHQKSVPSAKSVQCIDVDKTGQPQCAITKDDSFRCGEEKGPDSENVSAPKASPLTRTPAPTESTQRTSASVRRALFARRRFQPTAPSSPPEKAPSPPPAPPLRCSVPASACSSPGCHVSSSAQGSGPLRCLLPRIALSPKAAAAASSGSHHSEANSQDPPDSAQAKFPGELALPPMAPHPCRSRPAHNLLSHLPLHSQRSAPTPSLLIPIGGIHMIQPRPCSLRLFSSTATCPAGTSTTTTTTTTTCKLSDPPPVHNSLPPSPLTSRESPRSGAPKGELSSVTVQASFSKIEVSSVTPRKQKVD